MRLLIIPILLCVFLFAENRSAHAQYKSSMIGLEAGYFFFGEPILGGTTQLSSPTLGGGLNLMVKLSDNWWYVFKGLVSFPTEELSVANNTVIAFQTIPFGWRYFFSTDYFRPFISPSLAFNYFANTSQAVKHNVALGLGLGFGLEFIIERDASITAENIFYRFPVFQGDDANGNTFSLLVNWYF